MNQKKSKFIPKFKADVKILTENSNSQIVNNYTVFLRIKEESKKVESLKEFLQYENRLFLPLIRNNNTFELMNIHNIIYIKETEKSSAEAGKAITLTLVNKTKLKIKLSSNSIEDRLSDFINSKNNFLEFITEDGFNIHINKHKISLIREESVY
jgi:hypothetical protein